MGQLSFPDYVKQQQRQIEVRAYWKSLITLNKLSPTSDTEQRKSQGEMSIVLDKDHGIESGLEERIGLECPYCNVYAHMSPQSVPDAAALLRDKPRNVGLVYQCDACHAPVFLRFKVREYSNNRF